MPLVPPDIFFVQTREASLDDSCTWAASTSERALASANT